MSTHANVTPIKKQSGQPRKLTLYMVLGLFIVPFLLSGILFSLSEKMHFDTVNKGILITPPKNISNLSFKMDNDIALTMETLKGRWVMLFITDTLCETSCLEKFYAINQIRTALGKHSDKVSILYLTLPEGHNAALQQRLKTQYPSAHLGRVSQTEYEHFAKQLPAALLPLQNGGLFIVDPQNFLMMGYPITTDPMAILKDLKKVVQG